MILFRVDMDGQVGYGHGMRMLAVAHALRRLGVCEPHDMKFLTKIPGGGALPEHAAGFDVEKLWPAPEAKIGNTEYHWTMCTGMLYAGATLVVDARGEQADGFRRLREEFGVKIVMIDEMFATKDTADLVVMPNAHTSADTLAYLYGELGEQHVLSGWDYCLVREGIQSMSLDTQAKEAVAYVSAGGSDNPMPIEILMDCLGSISDIIPFTYGISPGIARLNVSALHHARIECFSFPHLASAAMLVCMFGQTVYEALALGMPVVAIPRRPDECDALSMLEYESDGYVRWVSTLDSLECEALQETVIDQWEDIHGLLRPFTRIDGKAADRIAKAIVEL